MATKKSAPKSAAAPAKKPAAPKATAVEKPAAPKAKGTILAERTGKVITRDGDEVLKTFEKGKAKVDILNEALNQARAEAAGLPVAALKEVRKNKDGTWSLVSEYAEGKTLDQIMKEDKKNFARHMATFIKIHIDVMSHKVTLMNPLLEKLDRQIAASELPEEQRYELHMQLAGLPKNICVCHGDFNPTNVIINPKGGYKIIDWAHVRRGNPLADIARTYLYFWINGMHAAAEKYIVGICEALNVEKRDVQRWLPVVAAAQSTKMTDPKNRDLLLHWASVVDYT
ncbi:MAG: aminoglycoside phosphotransferase family protein [Kiritimatiellae bacterium]|nr:aminoglycoside phosphotransferase family protein [Kiritimatiellia bacterium]